MISFLHWSVSFRRTGTFVCCVTVLSPMSTTVPEALIIYWRNGWVILKCICLLWKESFCILQWYWYIFSKKKKKNLKYKLSNYIATVYWVKLEYTDFWVGGCNLVVECVLSLHKALGSIPRTIGKNIDILIYVIKLTFISFSLSESIKSTE